MNLPVYKLSIDDEDFETGVNYVALVDQPAILVNWQAFKEHKKIKFLADTEKRIISGPMMIPNLPIYRKDDQLGEHYVVFDNDCVAKIVLKFFKTNKTNNVNGMHSMSDKLPGCIMFESFFIDSKRGTNTPVGYDALPDGTWWASYKIENDKVWNDFIRTGEFKGFSVEGNFNYSQPKTEDDQLVEAIVDAIVGVN